VPLEARIKLGSNKVRNTLARDKQGEDSEMVPGKDTKHTTLDITPGTSNSVACKI